MFQVREQANGFDLNHNGKASKWFLTYQTIFKEMVSKL